MSNDNLKIILIGGIEEHGKNMYVIEINESLYILDAGSMPPESGMLGIDEVIPDMNYIEQNKERVKGIFITSGHESSIGALPYLVKITHAPIYGTAFTLSMIKDKLKSRKYVKLNEINASSKVTFPNVYFSFFSTTHAIPGSVGVAAHTSDGVIVYTGHFKFDQNVPKPYQADMGALTKLGEKGVLCVLSDSSEAHQPGFNIPESKNKQEMMDVFLSANGRVIVACLSSNFIRIQQAIEAAVQSKRKIAFVNKRTEKLIKRASQLGYLDIPEDVIIALQDVGNYSEAEVAILVSGNQSEPFLLLQKMARQAHRYVNITSADTVYVTIAKKPSNELLLGKTANALYQSEATVNLKSIHVSSHAFQEDLKLLIHLLKPTYVLPVQGDYRLLVANAKVAKEIGIVDNRILIVQKGDVLEYKDQEFSISKKIYTGNILIDGIGVGDVGNIVLRDRRLLSKDGVIVIVVTLNKRKKQIASGPEIITRGFVYVRESEQLITETVTTVKDIVEDNLSKNTLDWTSIKQEIRDQVNVFLYEKTKRRPMILPIFMEV